MARTLLERETRRQQLLDAAIRVFARKGYVETSIDDIIKEAEVARGTFYLYFPGKKEIFLAIIDRYFELVSQLVERLMAEEWPAGLDRARFREHVLTWLRFFAQHRDLTKVIYREATSIDPQFEARWDRLSEAVKRFLIGRVHALQQNGVLRQTLDPQVWALFMEGIFHAVICNYLLTSERPDLEWLAEQWVDFVLWGITPAERDHTGG
uniref:Transcriptional regulator, TetR family n=1 Tax=Acetithermum autotrophicum TaxID=1446466 RepID=H5SVS0_ACEAU|nr:transcriptional regulator, TetR family [Candidatus Acetothermum autotrophicum]